MLQLGVIWGCVRFYMGISVPRWRPDRYTRHTIILVIRLSLGCDSRSATQLLKQLVLIAPNDLFKFEIKTHDAHAIRSWQRKYQDT